MAQVWRIRWDNHPRVFPHSCHDSLRSVMSPAAKPFTAVVHRRGRIAIVFPYTSFNVRSGYFQCARRCVYVDTASPCNLRAPSTPSKETRSVGNLIYWAEVREVFSCMLADLTIISALGASIASAVFRLRSFDSYDTTWDNVANVIAA